MRSERQMFRGNACRRSGAAGGVVGRGRASGCDRGERGATGGQSGGGSGMGERRMSLTDAAVGILVLENRPMNCTEIVSQVIIEGLWQSQGLTPEATLYSAILREITTKGEAARFRKVGRGLFELTGRQ